MRKRYTPQFKAKVVREILREEKSISQLSAEYGVHATQLRKWKNGWAVPRVIHTAYFLTYTTKKPRLVAPKRGNSARVRTAVY